MARARRAQVLTELYNGTAPVHKRMGGSIPAVGLMKHVRALTLIILLSIRTTDTMQSVFLQHLGIDTTGLAFSHPGCSVHAPDEHVAVRDLARGRAAYAAVLFRIARAAEHAAALAAAASLQREEL